MHGDEVGLRVDLLAVLGLLDAQLAVALGRDEWVEGKHAHTKAARTRGDELADAPEAEDAKRLLVQLDAGELRALPLAAGERGVSLGNVARQGKQQGHRVLGRGHNVRLRSIGDDDAAARGGLHVDVVHADTGATDHTQVLCGIDQLGRHLCRRTDQDAVVGADLLGQFLIGPVDAEVDVEVLFEQFDARVADLLLDEHLQTFCALAVIRSGAHDAILSAVQSIQAVSARTSSGSTAGNMPTRSWLRPSLR